MHIVDKSDDLSNHSIGRRHPDKMYHLSERIQRLSDVHVFRMYGLCTVRIGDQRTHSYHQITNTPDIQVFLVAMT